MPLASLPILFILSNARGVVYSMLVRLDKLCIYHHFDIQHRRTNESSVVARFNTDTHCNEDMTVMVIDGLHHRDLALHKIRENHWIRTMATASPQGMNLKVDKP